MKELIGEECFRVLDNDEYILFYFGASWCKPCQEILPSMEELIKGYDSNIIQFYKIDIDHEENKLICEKCKIKAVPSFLIFRERTFINRTKGNHIENVTQMINNAIYSNEIEEPEPTPIPEPGPTPISEPEPVKKDPFIANKELFNKDKLFN